jgi:preprotein translocase subunit SecE
MKIVDYIKETKGEMKHVSWPTRKQAIAYTIMVIVVSLFVAAFLGVFDYIFVQIVERLF